MIECSSLRFNLRWEMRACLQLHQQRRFLIVVYWYTLLDYALQKTVRSSSLILYNVEKILVKLQNATLENVFNEPNRLLVSS